MCVCVGLHCLRVMGGPGSGHKAVLHAVLLLNRRIAQSSRKPAAPRSTHVSSDSAKKAPNAHSTGAHLSAEATSSKKPGVGRGSRTDTCRGAG